MTISHGKNDTGQYDGSCFFIRHDTTKHEFIFFGDVEPDSVSVKPKNITIWRAAAQKIPHDLSTIFIECSYQAGRPDELLWGHLSPDHLVQEMITLATEVIIARRTAKSRSNLRPRKKQRKNAMPPEALYGALEGLKVYIMHCKELYSTERPINHVIGDQCRELLAPHKLGVELLTADQGMKIGGFCNRPIGSCGFTNYTLSSNLNLNLHEPSYFFSYSVGCSYRGNPPADTLSTSCIPSHCSLNFHFSCFRCSLSDTIAFWTHYLPLNFSRTPFSLDSLMDWHVTSTKSYQDHDNNLHIHKQQTTSEEKYRQDERKKKQKEEKNPMCI